MERQTGRAGPWQAFWLAVEFGWYREDGRRRFRTWYEEVARKNGKSTKLAGLGIYLFALDKEAGAQVYTAPPSWTKPRLPTRPQK
jgi:phage terminase large subunit-like protein